MSSSTAVNLASLGFGGMDTSTLVSSLVAVEQVPINQLTSQQQLVQNASATISQFSSTLSALKSAATTLSDPSSFQAMAATSSSPAIAASATGAPVAGQWSVSVTSVAQSQRSLSTGTSASDTGLGLSGKLGISLGTGASANVDVATTDSLTDIASKINAAGLRVQASVMYDGSAYHLLVSGMDTGASNKITFNESNLTSTPNPTTGGPGYSLDLAGATLQQAQDASVTIGVNDPVAGTSAVTVTSATNQVANAIPGVTLAVTQTTSSPATITVAGDSSALQNQVQAFVTAYNNVISNGHSTAGYGSTLSSNSLLQGDQAVRTSLDQLGQLMGEQVPGTSGQYTTLASVGVTMNDDGTLTFNSQTFHSAIQADPSSVQKLFVTDATTGATGIMSQFGSAIDSLTDPTNGAVQAEIKAFGQRSSRIGTEITDGQQRITEYQTQLQNEFNQMNSMLAQYKQIASSLNQSFNTNNSSNSNNVL